MYTCVCVCMYVCMYVHVRAAMFVQVTQNKNIQRITGPCIAHTLVRLAINVACSAARKTDTVSLVVSNPHWRRSQDVHAHVCDTFSRRTCTRMRHIFKTYMHTYATHFQDEHAHVCDIFSRLTCTRMRHIFKTYMNAHVNLHL